MCKSGHNISNSQQHLHRSNDSSVHIIIEQPLLRPCIDTPMTLLGGQIGNGVAMLGTTHTIWTMTPNMIFFILDTLIATLSLQWYCSVIAGCFLQINIIELFFTSRNPLKKVIRFSRFFVRYCVTVRTIYLPSGKQHVCPK